MGEDVEKGGREESKTRLSTQNNAAKASNKLFFFVDAHDTYQHEETQVTFFND